MQFITKKSKDYELLDSGDGEKLERFGDFAISRPEAQALWPKSLPTSEWKNCDGFYERTGERGKWHWHKKPIGSWQVNISDINFVLEPQSSKHIGIFPEQVAVWQLLKEIIYDANIRMNANGTNNTNKIQVLNLFAYTGGASLVCAKAGAEVTHVDASEYAINCAKANRDASGLELAPIRFILDDVRKFVEREIRRGKKYDVILLDPPIYGKGSKKEIWNIEEDLLKLILQIKKLLSSEPLAIYLGGYSSIYSAMTYKNLLGQITSGLSGSLESGELYVEESSLSQRLLPCGIFAFWKK